MYNIAAINNKGNYREFNNDYVLVNDTIVHDGSVNIESEYVLAVVCDGVGEYDGSNDASRITVECIKEYGIGNIENDIRSIEKCIIENKNKKCLHKSLTTIAGVVSKNDSLCVFNVGDSKVYKICNGFIEQISTSDSLYELNNALGLKSNENTKNIITNCIGQNKAYVHQININELKSTETLMICSDGVYSCLNYNEILKIIDDNKISLSNKTNNIFELASHKSEDNMSVILINRSDALI